MDVGILKMIGKLSGSDTIIAFNVEAYGNCLAVDTAEKNKIVICYTIVEAELMRTDNTCVEDALCQLIL